VTRMSPLFELSDAALNVILVIGSITALFMGFLGIIQNDIKRVVAYSTLSQLGYMTVALGVSAYNVAVFHLMTHAFFKALLFLGAGSVIMGMHHDQDIRNMGGLRKYMPITWITSLIGSLALIGTPFFSGFYSKDSIIEAVHASHLPAAGFAYFAVIVGVFVTAFYSFRMYFLVFHGKENFHHKPFPGEHDHHDDEHGDDHGHAHTPHESPWVVTVPLILLAIPSVVIGFLTIQPELFGDFLKSAISVNLEAHPAMEELAHEFHGATEMALHGFTSLPFFLALSGVIVAYMFYMVWPQIPAMFAKVLRPLIVIGENKYYLDWFNENVLAAGSRLIGRFFWKVGDVAIIDGIAVNGSAKVVGLIGSLVRLFQTGYLYHYALVMILGVFALMTWFVFMHP
jgi:NADH-quinone oxidoreductase subunit L